MRGCGQEFIFISVPFSDATERNGSICQGMWLLQSSCSFVSTEMGWSLPRLWQWLCPSLCLLRMFGRPRAPPALTLTPSGAMDEPWDASLGGSSGGRRDRDHLAQALHGRRQLLGAGSSPLFECPCSWHLPKAAELQTSCRS